MAVEFPPRLPFPRRPPERKAPPTGRRPAVGAPASAVDRLGLRFLDPATALSLTAHDREIREVHWVSPEDVAAHVSELSARRVALMLTGYRGYTEAGYPVA